MHAYKRNVLYLISNYLLTCIHTCMHIQPSTCHTDALLHRGEVDRACTWTVLPDDLLGKCFCRVGRRRSTQKYHARCLLRACLSGDARARPTIVQVCWYVYMYVCMYVYICVCMYVYVCMYDTLVDRCACVCLLVFVAVAVVFLSFVFLFYKWYHY